MDFVEDEEEIFRRIPFSQKCYTKDAHGDFHLSKSAFTFDNNNVSVDRSRLCAGDPRHTQRDPRHGVVSLIVGEVRTLSVVKNDTVIIPYPVADVQADPLPDNHAHALIVSLRANLSNSQFHSLQDQLAHMAEWKLYPSI